MTTFNILGCCILRDIFRIAQDETLKVEKFIQFVSPMSFMEEPQNCHRIAPEALSAHSEWSNFCKRNVCFDFNKSVLQTIRETPTNYIIIDLSELRFPVLRCIFADGSTCLSTAAKYQKILVEECVNDPSSPMAIVHYEECRPTPEEVEGTLRNYADFLTSLYDEHCIIVVENYMQYRHIDDKAEGFREYYSKGIRDQNNKLTKYYACLEKYLPHARYIHMPDYCLGDAGHLWGKDPLHFTDAYYHYLYKALRIILEERSEESERIEELRGMYSSYFALLEKQKRMEYFLASAGGHENLLADACLDSVMCNRVTPPPESTWRTSLSKGAQYQAAEHLLICGNEMANWAILHQDIDLDKLRGKTVCLSVKYRTFANSMLNMAIRCKKADNSMIYLATKQCCCDDYDNVDQLVAVIPDDQSIISAHVAVYCNHPGEMIRVQEVKLEYGGKSSLF